MVHNIPSCPIAYFSAMGGQKQSAHVFVYDILNGHISTFMKFSESYLHVHYDIIKFPCSYPKELTLEPDNMTFP